MKVEIVQKYNGSTVRVKCLYTCTDVTYILKILGLRAQNKFIVFGCILSMSISADL